MRSLNSNDVCNALYLTAPGKLWDNHTFQSADIREQTRQQLAVHVPSRKPSAIHTWKTWGIWCGVHTLQLEPVTSNQRKLNQPTNEAFANIKTDRVLDEYIKTCEVPLCGQPWENKTYKAPESSKVLKHAKKVLLSLQTLPSTRNNIPSSKRSDAPLDI